MAADERDERDEAAWSMSRRRFLRGVGVVGAGAAIADPAVLGAQDQPPGAADAQPDAAGDAPRTITLAVNGQDVQITAEPRVTLLSALRDYAEPPVTGPKLVCGMGTCGACTVLLDDKPVYSCLCLAADVEGKKITTTEGLGTPEKMNAVQQQFCEKDALMCGFCTPGFVTALSAVVDKNPNATIEQIKQGCAGNFCRCGTYPRVFEAGVAAAKA